MHAGHRNVGLVIETRPDWITPEEIRHLRKLGVTKVQIGVQSLDDEILTLNQRGHDVDAVRQALGLLRTAGFKLHLHWMPNLYGATPKGPRRLCPLLLDPAIRPDELKIYPCSLIAGTELYEYSWQGAIIPIGKMSWSTAGRCEADDPALYANQPALPRHPGASHPGRRQDEQLAPGGARRTGAAWPACGCIRCREIRRRDVEPEQLSLQIHRYATDLTDEYFLQFVTNEHYSEPGLIAGFLRLSLPV